MNRLNLAGQNVLSSPNFNSYKELGKPVMNEDTPTSQCSYNQKYYNQSVATGLESTFTSISFSQQTPISYRQAEQNDIRKNQELSKIINSKQVVSPKQSSKIGQFNATVTSNLSGVPSSYYTSMGAKNIPNTLQSITNNKTSRVYLQEKNTPLEVHQDLKDGSNSFLMNTQQRFIYSRNGSENTYNNSFYPQVQSNNQQNIFAVNPKTNIESMTNLPVASKTSFNSKYKVRSCVHMKSSTRLVNGDLTFQSQSQAINDQFLDTPIHNNHYQKSHLGNDEEGFSSQMQGAATPITFRQQMKMNSAKDLFESNPVSSRSNLNLLPSSSMVKHKSSQDQKDIVNLNNDILIESKLNISQIKDPSKLLNASGYSDRNSLLFQSNISPKILLEQQQPSSSTLKNVFYQQLATNKHLQDSKINTAKNQIGVSHSSTVLQARDLHINTNSIRSNEMRKRTQSKQDDLNFETNKDREEDRRMYEELLDMSPLPKSRKLANNAENKSNLNSSLISIQACKKEDSTPEEKDQNDIDSIQQKQNEGEIKRENNTNASTIHSATNLGIGVQSERNIRVLSTFESKKSQKGSHAYGVSTPNLNKSINKKDFTSYVSDATLLEQAKTTKNFAIHYKKINHIIDEVRHFNDQMEVGTAMLTTTLTKNVLPRKLGIVATLNPNQKSIGDALKKRKKRQSFDANGSPIKLEQKGELPALVASQKGKRVSEFMYNTNIDSSDEKLQSIQSQLGSVTTPNNLKTFKASTPIPFGNAAEKNSQQQPLSILKRSTSQSNNNNLKKAPSTLLNYNYGLTEFEKKRPFDKVAFKDSHEVANYLQKNHLTTRREEDDPEEEKRNLNLSRLQISKTYCEMLAQALRHPDFEHLNSLNLQDNNLTGNALLIISQNLPAYLRKLDLSNNFLISSDASSICNILNCKQYGSLVSLNLSNNLLTDAGLKSFSKSLQKNSTLLSINLSHNKLTDLSSPQLKEILVQNSGLQELYLNWNKISSKSGIEIAQGLSNNFNIKVLDISHNCLGQNPNLHCGKKLIESCSKLESGVIHIDLSYNLFTKSECQEIADTLSKNRKIYGVHFEGNESHATIDSRGFLYFPNEDEILQKHVSTHTLMRRDIKSVKCLGNNKLQNFNCNVTDNCWICDGWQEIEFEIREGSNDAFLSEPAFLHLDFEDFKPMYMDRDPEDPSRYFLRRMCPPNRIILFFFTNPCTKLLFESNDYDKVDFHVNEQNLAIYEDDDENTNQSPEKQNDAQGDKIFSAHHLQNSKQRKFNVKYLDGTVMEYIVPTTVNCVRTKLHKNINKNKGDYEIQIKCLPRQEETYYKINYTNQWHRGISLFKQYVADNPELELKCFEDDWHNSKLQQILSYNDKTVNLNECKQIIVEQYPQIRVLFRYLSCFGLTNDVFCVTFPPFALFAQQSKIIDNNLMRMRDLECIFIAASSKAMKVKNFRAPEKSLTRSEFIEMIGRIAVDKYIRTKVAKSSSEALSLLLNSQSLAKHLVEYEDPQQWRNVRFWTKQCDEMMKRYLNFIKTLWNEYADSRKGEKKGAVSTQKTMSLQEFQDMVNEFNLKDSLLTEREVIMSFNLSLQSIVDEINSEKYMAMSFVEFLEGIARLAEFKSRTPVGERDEAYPASEKVQIRLEYKIESILESMSIQYQTVMKLKKKKQLLLQKQLSLRNINRLQSLKSKRSFIQYSQPEIEEESGINKFTSTVYRVMNSMSVINAFKNSINSSNSLTEENENNLSSKVIVAPNTLSTQSELPKPNNKQLHRIDSEMDEFDDEENSFILNSKPSQKKITKILGLNQVETKPISLKEIDDSY